MKKNKIFRFASALSVLGISSLVISSCSQAQDSKKPEPKPAPGGGNNQSDQGNPGGGTNPDNGTNPGNQTKPQNEADQVKSLIDGLNASSFKLVDTTNSNQDVELDTVEAQTVKNDTKYSFLLRDVSQIPSGWKYVVKATDADTKKGVVQVDVEFTKDGVDPVKSTKSIEVDGFKSLPTTVKNSFFTKVDLGEQYKGANKTALNVGDVKFAKLSEINKEKALEEKTQTEAPAAESTEGTSLREEAQVTITTNGFQTAFMETLQDSGSNKAAADKIKETEPTFKAEDLYITGQATVDSIWQNTDEKTANFYLTSKDPAHPLKLKSKTSPEIDITIPGIVVKNILPDDVKISVSKVNVEGVSFDPANQSNLEAYKKVAEGEQEGIDKYKFENDQLFATVSNKDYKINPIHIPYIAQKNNHNIFFKARYIFDDKDMFTDAFTTKIAFKKITQNDSLSSEVVSIKELADQNNNKLEYFSTLVNEKPDGGNIVDRFFWTGVGPNGVVADGQQSTDTEISGDQNKDDGEGVAQMVNWKSESNANNQEELLDSNKNAATNYIIYTRIKYAKDESNYGYSWSNQVTILHIDAPTSTSDAAATTTTDTASSEEK
ncbi:hypothetical protein [Mycoplasma sp. E35C]|uniref:hypothetical protein n=1 Tax=Mycoplasma sp. E35C TaxID=2801918 RepID=UPI001CA395C3|nr:hypothetical protein [Mycoplasma sp. E35C]QZX49130.1 hypothetical protein JJE79_03705 [Mycoplasma sp. E35C]